MGYSFNVYSVELAKLKKVWGSEDETLKKALLKKQKAAIAENDENWADEIADEEVPSLTTAIDDIFAGEAQHEDSGFQYGYALEVICKHLGKRIDEEEFTWFDEFLDPLLKKRKQPSVEKLLGRNVYPMPIPEPDDFPEIGTIDTKGIAALAKALDAIEDDAEDNDDVTEILVEVRKWIASAKQAKRQIVWFVY